MLKLIQVFSIISLAFLLVSCKHLKVDGKLIKTNEEKFIVPYFNVQNKDYLFSTRIKVYGNEMSGLLAVKKLGNQHKRLALLTDFGNTLIDMEFQGEQVKVNYVVEDLNRKVIINQFKRNFQLLLQSEYIVKDVYEVDEGKVFTSKFQGKKIHLHVNQNENLTKLVQANVFKNKNEINYFKSLEGSDSIYFTSHQFPIEVILNEKIK